MLSAVTQSFFCRVPFMLIVNIYMAMLSVVYADCGVMLSVIMLSVIMLSVIMLSVIMLSVIMLSVVAPFLTLGANHIF